MKRRRSSEPSPLDRPDPRYPEPDDDTDADQSPADEGAAPAAPPVRVWPRVTARLVDYVVLQIVTTPVTWVGDGLTAFVAFTVVAGVYEIATTAVWGQTGGKWLVGLRVVDPATDRPPSVTASALRWLALLYWFPYFDLRLAWTVAVLGLIRWGPRRGPHELVSRTVVRTVPPGRIRRGGGR